MHIYILPQKNVHLSICKLKPTYAVSLFETDLWHFKTYKMGPKQRKLCKWKGEHKEKRTLGVWISTSTSQKKKIFFLLPLPLKFHIIDV